MGTQTTTSPPLQYGSGVTARRRPAAPRLVLRALVLAAVPAGGGVAWSRLRAPRGFVCGIPAARISCAHNVSRLWLGLSQYARANGGAYPDSASAMRRAAVSHPADIYYFICRSSAGRENVATGATIAAAMADLGRPGHTSYAYVGDGLSTDAGPDAVLMYESAPNPHGGTAPVGCVLFADGQIRHVSAPTLASVTDQAAAGTRPVRDILRPTTRPGL